MTREDLKFATDRFAGERHELDAVMRSGIFAASSNAAKLLRYICERHFANPAEPVSEYEAAVHGLGRRTNFDSQKDSIVRVEAHRLRRRLQEYYATDGASHPFRISLPRGQYTPEFTPFIETSAVPSPVKSVFQVETVSTTAARRKPYLWPLVALAVVALAAGGVAGFELSRRDDKGGRSGFKPVVLPGLATSDSVHILAGRSVGFYMDRLGTQWSSDSWYTGGHPGGMRFLSLVLADDPAIYKNCRIGKEFTYDIPLQPGRYEMRLMFAESGDRVPIMGEVGEGYRSIQVFANGTQILPPPDGRHRRSLDIIADAGGVDTADVKVFKDISPAADGKLHLRFFGSKEDALVNGITLVPGLPGKMRPLRWRAADTPYADQAGNLWLADHYYRGGRSSHFRNEVGDTKDPGLYQGERFGAFTYSVPVVAGDSYNVTVHFAENYFGAWSKPLSPPRIFNVYANYSPVLQDFNITRAAGGPARAVTRTFRGIKPNSADKINLTFEPVTEFAVVNAIEVEDQSR